MKFLQPSLSGGEMAPGLQGRVDIARYVISVKTCRNFVTRPTGGAVKRPGWRFRGEVKDSSKYTRLLPFVYSTEIKYLIEAGDLYFRFWVNGALLTEAAKTITGATAANPVVVTSNAHGFSNGQEVVINGVVGMTQINGLRFVVAGTTANTFQLSGINGAAHTAYASGGTASRVVEVVTPYSSAYLPELRITQSADVLYLVHKSIAPRELRRLTATSFELKNFEFRRGPFRSLNGQEAILMAVSAATGNVTVTVNANVFNANMVGSLVYLEEKELRTVKPWEPLDRSVTVGALRRSDGKVYKCVGVPSLAGVPGTAPYYITGNTRPLHEVGRAFDGPQDTRNDGVNGYRVGVEWEYAHGGFGIVKVTGYGGPTNVTGVVIQRIPDSIVGTAPAPGSTWTLNGNGITKVFATVGAISDNPGDYAVTIGGTAVSPDPYYEPTTGGGGVGGGSSTGPRLGDPIAQVP